MRTSNPGVYKITNKVNGKFYVGSTAINLLQRWNDHKSQLRAGKHSNIHLQRSYDKHGIGNFVFEILSYCDNVLEIEQYYIDTLKPQYNIEKIAGSSIGVKRSMSTRNKISRTKLGNRNRVGQIKTTEEIQKISNTLKEGYKTGRIKHWIEGKTHSLLSRTKLSKSLKGNSNRKNSPTYRNILQLDLSGKLISLHTTARLAAISIGRLEKSDSSKIVRACREPHRTAFGYRWKFKENVPVKSGELLGTP